MAGCRQVAGGGRGEQIVQPPARFTYMALAHGDNAAVGEVFLLADLIVGPASIVEFGQHVFSAGIGFGYHRGISLLAFHLSLEIPVITFCTDLQQCAKQKAAFLLDTESGSLV